MKPARIPCDYLVRESSPRAAALFFAIRPYLKASMTYLDIGCGTAPLTHFIDEALPPARYVGIDLNSQAIGACKTEYPHHTWLCMKSDAFVIETGYDVIIHTGINARRFSDAEIHERILDASFAGPSAVLLESGDYHDGPSDTHEIYEELRQLYLVRGFRLEQELVLVISHFPVPVRRYAVFTRS